MAARKPGKFLTGVRRFLGLDRPKYQRPLRPKAYERPLRPKAYLSNPERERLRRGETELEQAIRKAIVELEGTRSSFKSKQIMRIKEELARALARKP